LSDRSSHPDSAGAAFVPVLVGITLVVSIISSLGAPLLPDVAKELDISLPSAQWSLTAALIAGALSAPILGRLGDGRHRRRSMLGALVIVSAGGIVAGAASCRGSGSVWRRSRWPPRATTSAPTAPARRSRSFPSAAPPASAPVIRSAA
jgi:MFS family permease